MAVDSKENPSGGRALRRSNSLPQIRERVKGGASPLDIALTQTPTGDDNPDSPGSPKSPLSCLVRESFRRNPVVPQHHTLHLNEFDELHLEHCGTRTPTPPGLQRQRHSTSSLTGDDSKKNSRTSSKESTQVCSRKPSKEEIKRRIQDEVDWFHATRAINKSIRTSEETEALLAAARLRRVNGKSSRSGSKQSVASVKDEVEALEEVQPVPERRKMDMAALWGAKPVAKAPPKDVQPTVARTTSSSMRTGAQCGQEESLRSRLLKRRATVQCVAAFNSLVN